MSNSDNPLAIDVKHKKFCDEFLSTNRKGASAIAAGYSKKSAHTEASRLLKRPDVQRYLAHRVAEMTQQQIELETKTRDTLDQRIITEVEAMAFANIADFVRIDEEGKPQVDFSTATREQLRAITSIKSKTSRRYDGKGAHIATDEEAMFTLADKYRGLELLGKHRGLFKADEQRIVVDVADRLLTARRRVALADAGTTDAETSRHGGGGTGV